MRIWGVDPTIMCSQHLLGEHSELHMMAGSYLKGKNFGKLLDGCIDLSLIMPRHEELVREFERRGWSHKSPIPNISEAKGGWIDKEKNLTTLTGRCYKCRERQKAPVV